MTATPELTRDADGQVETISMTLFERIKDSALVVDETTGMTVKDLLAVLDQLRASTQHSVAVQAKLFQLCGEALGDIRKYLPEKPEIFDNGKEAMAALMAEAFDDPVQGALLAQILMAISMSIARKSTCAVDTPTTVQ